MADQDFALTHDGLLVFGAPIDGEELNDHEITALSTAYDRWAVAYLHGGRNRKLTNNLPYLINAPLRFAQTSSSSAIANTTTPTYFNKTGTILAGIANEVGAVIEVTMVCHIKTKASSPGNLTIGIFAGAAAGGALVMVQYSPVALVAGLAAGTGLTVKAHCTVRSTGASGTWARGGQAEVPGSLAQSYGMNTLTTADLTADIVVNGAVTFSVADVDNSITQMQLYGKVMRAGVAAS